MVHAVLLPAYVFALLLKDILCECSPRKDSSSLWNSLGEVGWSLFHQFKDFGMINLQYEIRIWQKIYNRVTMTKIVLSNEVEQTLFTIYIIVFHLCLHSKSNFHDGPSCSIISKAWLCMSSVGFFYHEKCFLSLLQRLRMQWGKLFLNLHHLVFWSCLFT